MATGRFKNIGWALPATERGLAEDWDTARTALLMDIRDELQQLNSVFACPNFVSIPRELRAIKRELATIRKAGAK